MKTWILVVALMVVAVLAYKVWEPYVSMSRPKREVPNGEARLYFFYTDWCGFSQKAMPEWEALEPKLAYFGTTHVTPVRVNAEEDTDTAALYDIHAYPTILLETKDGLYPYTKRPTTEGLLHFLRQTLGKETEGR